MSWTPRSDWIDVTAAPYNADPSGQTDSTVAINSALAAASDPLLTCLVSTAPKTVYLPPGNYKISDTLHWNTGTSGLCGLTLIGSGSSTTIFWSGTAGGTMFKASLVKMSRYIGIRWDGQNLAATGILHNALGKIAEAPVRHQNEAFVNFTGVALNCDNKYQGVMGCWTGQMEVWNCLFYNCVIGSQIGLNAANNYEYMFEKCEFENCGTGIDSWGNTAQMVYDTHFANSTVTDMTSKLPVRVRRVTSTGSKAFFVTPPWSGSAGNMHVFQDCWVDSWTNTGTGIASGAMQIGDRIEAMIFDCKFTNPPNTARPINLICPTYGTRGVSNLLVSNNSYPGVTDQSAMVQTGANGGVANVLVVPPGSSATGITASLSSANTTFLDSTAVVDGTNILDVTQSPYNAKNDTSVDATAAIQQAINAARTAGNGAVVYLPAGYYKVSSPLVLTGSNYKLQGSGSYTHLCWNGATGSTVISVSNVNNVAVESLTIKVSDSAAPTTAGITQTSTVAGRFTVDWVWFGRWGEFYPHSTNQLLNYATFNAGQGLKLNSLGAGTQTYLGCWSGPINIVNCGAAEIFGNHINGGQLNVSGSSAPTSGFLGFLYSNVGLVSEQTPLYDVNVRNNQSIALGDFYNEQTHNNINLEGNGASWNGQVAVQGFKQQCWDNAIALNLTDYKGSLFYGPQCFINVLESSTSATFTCVPPRMVHSGTNPVDLVLPMDIFHAGTPTVTAGTSCNIIQAYNEWRKADYTDLYLLANVPNPLTDASLASIAGGLDYLRQLGREDLKFQFGISGAAPIFQADFNGATTATGATMLLNPNNNAVVTPTLCSSSSLGAGNYLNVATSNATGSPNIVRFTPASASNSWAALAQGTTNGGANTVLCGGFDMLVRPNVIPSGDQAWLRPVDVDNRTNGGLRIILTGVSNYLQFQLAAPTGVNALSTSGTNYNLNTVIMTPSFIMSAGTTYHIAFTFNTDTTGRITLKLFAQPAGEPIDTAGTPLVQTSFYLSAALVTPANTFSSGAWTTVERSLSSPFSNNIDFDCIRLYGTDPGVFATGE